MSYTDYPNGVSSMGIPLPSAGRDISGSTYFVDNNSGSDSNDGSTWTRAFKTLAKAIAISNVDIARGSDRWARRNTIYYAADTETADLVAFPNKCDIIGAGSYDANTMPGITGNHVPVNVGNYGSRFINIWFKAPADAAPIVTLASSSSGAQFIGCVFSATATTTIGIQVTASPFMKVIGCRFEGAFVTSYITFGTGEAGGTLIKDNIMGNSAAGGVIVPSDVTSSWISTVSGNLIQAATLTVNDDADLFYYYNNRLVSLATATSVATCAEAVDIPAFRSQGNYLSAANVTNILWPTVDTTT
jgi:hypothetical protein